MSKISEIFNGGRKIFVPFWMIGYPNEAECLEVLKTLEKHADILELGIPFSDPVADGTTIQQASKTALEGGMNTDKAFELIKRLNTKKLIVLLIYLNIILGYKSQEEFFKQAFDAGVCGIVVPEISLENASIIEPTARKYGISLIYIISTNTPIERVLEVDRRTDAFIYFVSKPSITGVKMEVETQTLTHISSLRKTLKSPLVVGFGISSKTDIEQLYAAGADGAIIGSKLISLETAHKVSQFLNGLHTF
jgi:tryptophan synthase alpha chain